MRTLFLTLFTIFYPLFYLLYFCFFSFYWKKYCVGFMYVLKDYVFKKKIKKTSDLHTEKIKNSHALLRLCSFFLISCVIIPSSLLMIWGSAPSKTKRKVLIRWPLVKVLAFFFLLKKILCWFYVCFEGLCFSKAYEKKLQIYTQRR